MLYSITLIPCIISKLCIQCRSEPQWGWGSEAISCSYSYLHSWWLGILLPWTCCWYGFTGDKRLFADIFFLPSSRMILLFISSKTIAWLELSSFWHKWNWLFLPNSKIIHAGFSLKISRHVCWFFLKNFWWLFPFTSFSSFVAFQSLMHCVDWSCKSISTLFLCPWEL